MKKQVIITNLKIKLIPMNKYKKINKTVITQMIIFQ